LVVRLLIALVRDIQQFNLDQFNHVDSLLSQAQKEKAFIPKAILKPVPAPTPALVPPEKKSSARPVVSLNPVKVAPSSKPRSALSKSPSEPPPVPSSSSEPLSSDSSVPPITLSPRDIKLLKSLSEAELHKQIETHRQGAEAHKNKTDLYT
jgi:hypothetical protein